ncbi:TetR/AcrR family transcriptional regulator [Candidatus Enterococcus ferrettii]|uniref:HTH tetR-type domain-containing protein n=1 Tax=Candidatus Enterococcus ferrettii TaxID=2815324 RepID=A0ABV0EX31_9ENTE|nr:TetR/AcrR family transcriptional regulator [Enterococcus sp. 665A]MBO1338763.1 TetR/AcrR family transcriptional regulator [Enterococcus sp. 665A]
MSNKTDRTKQHIITIFFEMMDEIGFDKITVAGLSKRAKINRGTFYHYYVDKYALLEEVEEEMYSSLEQVMKDHVGVTVKSKIEQYGRANIFQFFKEACENLMIFLYERKELAQVLIGENGRPQFIERLERLYIKTVQLKLQNVSPEITESEKLQQEFIYYGVIAIVKRWLRTGARQSPEEIAEILAKSMTTSPISIFEEIESR